MTATRWLGWALALTPQVFHLGSQSPFLLTKAVFLSLVGAFAGLALVLAWRRDACAPALPPALLAPAAFVAYAALRAPWGAEARPEIASPFLWGMLPLVAWPGAAAAQTAAAPGRTPRLLVCLGGLTAAYAVLQFLGIDLPVYRGEGRVISASFHAGAGRPPFATLGNPNFLGEYLAPLLPLALAGMLVEMRWWRWLAGGAGLLMAAALPLTLARGPWLAAAAGLAAAVLLGPRTGDAGRRLLRVGALLALGGLLIAAALEVGGGGARPLQKLTGTVSRILAGGEGRQLWWAVAGAMVAEHPLVGIGTGRFRETYPAYQGRILAARGGADAAVPEAPVESPHNDYLQVAAELGIPGLLLLLGGLGGILWGGVRELRRDTEAERIWRAGALGGLMALLAEASVGYPLHTATGVFLLGALSALATVPAATRGAGPGARPRWQMLLLLAATAFGIWQAGHLLRVYAGSLHLHRGTEALLRGNRDAALEALERAHQVSPRDSEIRTALGQAWYIAGRPDRALPHLEAGLGGFDSARLRTLLGRAHLALGHPREADEVLRQGVLRFPGAYAPLHLAYGSFLAGRGRDAEAGRELARALALDPSLADAYFALGLVRARGGETEAAAEAFRQFLRRARPGDPRAETAAAAIRRAEASPPHVDNTPKPAN